jgi:hypothetical protein
LLTEDNVHGLLPELEALVHGHLADRRHGSGQNALP